MRMNERMDEGDILLQRATPIGADETYGALQTRLAAFGAAALMEALDGAARRARWRRRRRTTPRATLAPMIRKEQGAIDWTRPAAAIARQVRAFNPWPSAYHHAGAASCSRSTRARVDDAATGAAPGTVLDVGDRIRVATGDGVLAIDELQLEGRKRAAGARVRARRRRCAVGDRLGARRRGLSARRARLAGPDRGRGRRLRRRRPRRSACAARSSSRATGRWPTQLVYGTLAWQGLLDHVIAQLRARAAAPRSRRAHAAAPGAVSAASSSIACRTFAAVDTAVELAKDVQGRRARAAWSTPCCAASCARASACALPAATSDPARPSGGRRRRIRAGWSSAGSASSAPKRPRRCWRRTIPPAPTVLRVNPRARRARARGRRPWRDAQVAARPTRYAADAPGHRARRRSDRAARLARRLVHRAGRGVAAGRGAARRARRAMRVLDVCAAPGGKATRRRGARSGRGGCVLARRPQSPPACASAAPRRARLGAGRVAPRARRCDGAAAAPPRALRRGARRRAVLRARHAAPASGDPLAPAAGIGSTSWRACRRACSPPRRAHVRPGGALVYATCTIVATRTTASSTPSSPPTADFAVDDPRPLPAAGGARAGRRAAVRCAPSRIAIASTASSRCG